MNRLSKWIAALAFGALLGMSSPTITHAQDAGSYGDLAARQQAEVAKAADIMSREGVGADDPRVKQHLDAAAQMGQLADQAAQRESISNQLKRVTEQMERDREAAEAAKPPSAWEQAGNQILQSLIAMLMDLGKQKLNEYINGGGKDDALLDQIKNLEDERTRLEEELANGGTGNTPGSNGGLGDVITDPNGNTGYDTDGNGYVDIPLYPNGTPGSPGSDAGTDPISSLPGSVLPTPLGSDPSSLDKDDTSSSSLPASLGGGANFGGNSGPGFGGLGGPNGPNAATPGAGVAGANGEGKDGEVDANAIPGVGGVGTPGAEGGTAGGIGGKDGEGSDTTADGRTTQKKLGRVIVLPKLEFENLAGDRKAKDDWSEEWKDDSWDDAADNGDFDEDWAEDDDWGGDWKSAEAKGSKKKAAAGEGKTTADDQQAAELVDQIIRVETAVAEWRKLEVKAKEAGVDPYGFQDEEMGYRASGTQERDPFKDVRTKDGKIDLTKVDVWLVEGETWKDGEEPVRYRLKIDSEEITDFEPIHGGVAMVQGVLTEMDVDKRVLDEIKGKVKELEVVRVLLSAEKPPEDTAGLEGETPAAEGEEGLDAPAPEGTKRSSDTKPEPAPATEGWDDEGW